jgi:hypothetical protein
LRAALRGEAGAYPLSIPLGDTRLHPPPHDK